MKQKKDKVFIFVIGLIIANLAWYLAGNIAYLFVSYTNIGYWATLVANIIALIGALWLFRSYRRGIKIEKQSRKEN